MKLCNLLNQYNYAIYILSIDCRILIIVVTYISVNCNYSKSKKYLEKVKNRAEELIFIGYTLC